MDMFEVTIAPGEAIHNYGVNTQDGFTIAAETPLSKKDFFKIRGIIGGFVEHQKALEEHSLRTKLTKEMVASKKAGDEHGEPEHWHSLARLQDTEITMQDLKKTHRIVQISVLKA